MSVQTEAPQYRFIAALISHGVSMEPVVKVSVAA